MALPVEITLSAGTIKNVKETVATSVDSIKSSVSADYVWWAGLALGVVVAAKAFQMMGDIVGGANSLCQIQHAMDQAKEKKKRFERVMDGNQRILDEFKKCSGDVCSAIHLVSKEIKDMNKSIARIEGPK